MNNDMTRYDEMTGEKPGQSRTLIGSVPTTYRQAPDKYSAASRLMLISLLLITMLTGGAAEAWGQDDYSGFYYIASSGGPSSYTYSSSNRNNNFYLCPATQCYYNPESNTNFLTSDNGMPHLTTYKSFLHNAVSDAIWHVTSVTVSGTLYYRFYHVASEKYLTYNTGRKISNNSTRLIVHLEAAETPDENNTLFIVTYSDGKYLIRPKNVTDTSKALNVSSDNLDQTNPGSNKGGIQGTIGYYNITGNDVAASYWYFEKVAPIISYNNSNLIEISYVDEDAAIYYSYGEESTPSEGTFSYSTPFDPLAGTTTIKAIAIKDGKESGIATFTPPVFLGSTHKYLIQSQNFNTTYVSWTEPCYYMIPSDADNNSNITVNTTTLLQPSMEWYFLNAGIESDVQYYYIVNNTSKDNENHPYYLCYDSGVFMRVFDSENANKFKFSIVQYPTTGIPTDYNLKPYGQTSYIHKSNGNNAKDVITLNSSNSSGTSRWKFIKKADLPTSLPFSVSDNRKTYYYKLSTDANSDYFITPSTTNQYVTTYNTTSDNQNWYFEQAEAATDADWLTYYHIRNAITGEYLYYNGTVDGNNHSNAFELHSSIGSETDRYKFAITRAVLQDRWFIVPKVLRNTQFAQINTIWRDSNNPLKTQKTRNNGSTMWQFTESNFCMPPFFEESDGSITISCDTKGAEIHYLTNGNDPTEASTLYNNDTWDSSDQVRVKAIAVVKDGETVTASSAVVTLLNKPDITLEAGPYEYNGAAWLPSVSSVSIGESGSETTAPTSPATYTTAYINNINAGTATVTLNDVEGDSWYILNGSTTFTITQKAITITAASDTKGYDGTPLTNDGYTYSPALATGDSFESVTITGSQTDVGSSSNVPSAAVIKNESDDDMTANYDITYVNGTLVVTVRSIGDGTNPALGFTISFGDGNTFILKDGEITLTPTTDYTIDSESTSASGKYSTRTVSGAGNYTGSFTIRNAFAHFTTDADRYEWSATFVAESAGVGDIGHALPDGITAYIITDIEDNWAVPEPLDYIPEGVPVLLLANEEKNGFLVEDADGDDVTVVTQTQKDNNMLKEVTDDPWKHFNTKEVYLLYNNEFVFNKDGYLAKGKVYLVNPNYSSPSPSPSPSRLLIAWGQATGIDDAHLSPLTSHHSAWYALDGRHLSGKPTKKGLYLRNGQKVVVR